MRENFLTNLTYFFQGVSGNTHLYILYSLLPCSNSTHVLPHVLPEPCVRFRVQGSRFSKVGVIEEGILTEWYRGGQDDNHHHHTETQTVTLSTHHMATLSTHHMATLSTHHMATLSTHHMATLSTHHMATLSTHHMATLSTHHMATLSTHHMATLSTHHMATLSF